MPHTLGERFARAVASKDKVALRSLLARRIDFRALTPGGSWEATSSREVIDEVILGHWFEPGDHIERLCSITTSTVGDRPHVAYRLVVRNADGVFLVEQQAYYTAADGTITWMRLLCSGFRPVEH